MCIKNERITMSKCYCPVTSDVMSITQQQLSARLFTQITLDAVTYAVYASPFIFNTARLFIKYYPLLTSFNNTIFN